MPNLVNETLVRVSQVPDVLAEEFPYMPRKPHKHSAWRWTSQGVRGSKLESIKLMGELYTSREAIRRFWVAAMVENSASSDDSGKRRRVANAKRKLRKVGA